MELNQIETLITKLDFDELCYISKFVEARIVESSSLSKINASMKQDDPSEQSKNKSASIYEDTNVRSYWLMPSAPCDSLRLSSDKSTGAEKEGFQLLKIESELDDSAVLEPAVSNSDIPDYESMACSTVTIECEGSIDEARETKSVVNESNTNIDNITEVKTITYGLTEVTNSMESQDLAEICQGNLGDFELSTTEDDPDDFAETNMEDNLKDSQSPNIVLTVSIDVRDLKLRIMGPLGGPEHLVRDPNIIQGMIFGSVGKILDPSMADFAWTLDACVHKVEKSQINMGFTEVFPHYFGIVEFGSGYGVLAERGIAYKIWDEEVKGCDGYEEFRFRKIAFTKD